jgi:S-(hydroxymethyl)glutathione dehydrogenase / alcohol dehydrogenase
MSETTQAAILVQSGEPLQIIELTLPELQAGQVLVDVAYAGVCRSQLMEARGLKGHDPYLPHALGHEGAGIVKQVGPNVTKVKPGDSVVLSWIKGQGTTVHSTQYESKIGIINSGAVACFMNQTITCESCVVPIPKEMPPKLACLLGCAVPTGAGVCMNHVPDAEQTVAIFGVGGIGLSAVLGAKMLGVQKIIAVDILDHKLKIATDAGATSTINASHQDPITAIKDLTGGKGVDYAIECSGNSKAMEQALASCRQGGGQCIVAGNLPHGQVMEVNPYLLIQGRTLKGTWGGETQTDRDIPKYVQAWQSGTLNLEPFIKDEYALVDINQAMNDMEAGKVTRAIIKMQNEQKV